MGKFPGAQAGKAGVTVDSSLRVFRQVEHQNADVLLQTRVDREEPEG